MATHDEKTSAGRAKMLSGGDTRDRLAEVDEVLGAPTSLIGIIIISNDHSNLRDSLQDSNKSFRRYTSNLNKRMRHGHTHARSLPSEIFSPESGGRVKASSAMDEMRTHGMMRLKDKDQDHLEPTC